MKKVAITGGTGMIGSAIVNCLISQGCETLVFTRHKELEKESTKQKRFIYCDLADLDKFDCNLRGYDTFIHLGWCSTTGAARDNAEIQELNIKFTLDAVKLAKKLGCTCFIGAGSQAEYGITDKKMKAGLECNPESAYGVAKYTAGKLSKILANQLGMRHCWTRILSVYGPKDNPNSLISYVIRSLLNGDSPELTKCEQEWDYIYVEDCAKAICCIAANGKNGAVYPIGSGETLQLREYVEIIKNKINKNANIQYGVKNYYPHQPMYLCADIDNLEKDTGYKRSYSFEEGIIKTIEYIRGRK